MKLSLSKIFTPWKDQESGITSYILTTRVAPIQQSFYFVNTSFSKDNRFLWFFCAFPPAGDQFYGRALGVADLKSDIVHLYPETLFVDPSPLVDPVSHGVYWCTYNAVCFRGPLPEDSVKIVCELPDEYYGKRAIRRVATHLTLSADGKELLLDSLSGDLSFAASVEIKTGTFNFWRSFERDYKHAQFSPTDPDLALIAQDHFYDMATGAHRDYENRIWLLRRDGEFQPLFPRTTRLTHEWWDRDGKHIYAINGFDQFGGPGIVRISIDTSTVETVWKGIIWHAMDFQGKYFAADKTLKGFYRGCPSSVNFLNRETGKEIAIVTHNPEFQTRPSVYHVDPHPAFSPDGSFIVFTTTVLGRVDVAVVPSKELIKLTS
jgi:hypothetical protein